LCVFYIPLWQQSLILESIGARYKRRRNVLYTNCINIIGGFTVSAFMKHILYDIMW